MNKNVIAALLVSVFASAVAAESIKDIQVKGSGRVDPAVIRSYLRSKTGDTYDPQVINDDLKNLFATGLFCSISFSFEGQKLFIQVSENPILNEIAFEGMSAVPEDMVKKDYRDTLPKISLPTLLLYGGEKNQVFPTPLGKWVQSQIPNSELVIFSDSGHAPFWEESEKYNESIIRFIKE